MFFIYFLILLLKLDKEFASLIFCGTRFNAPRIVIDSISYCLVCAKKLIEVFGDYLFVFCNNRNKHDCSGNLNLAFIFMID